MNEIVRQEGVYSLIKVDNDSSLCYYIDSGDEVSEYMDRFDIEDLLTCDSGLFIGECNNMFL
jgi:hypothetical protein